MGTLLNLIVRTLLAVIFMVTAPCRGNAATTPAQAPVEETPRRVAFGPFELDEGLLVETIVEKKRGGREDARLLVRELVRSSERTNLPLDILVGVAWHESNFTLAARSPSGEYCGPFQQGPRFSMSPPMKELHIDRRPCRDVAACRAECDRLRTDLAYAISRLERYLSIVRARTYLRAQVCRYQSGPYGPCSEAGQAYQRLHEGHRADILRRYQRKMVARAHAAGYSWIGEGFTFPG